MDMLAERLASRIKLARCDVRNNAWAEQQYQIVIDPTFITFQGTNIIRRMQGVEELLGGLKDIGTAASDAGGASGSSSAAAGNDGKWLGAPMPANFMNLTPHVELSGLDIMNANPSLGDMRVLLADTKPSGLAGKAPADSVDWVESDTDEQLMLLVPFQGGVKLHSIQITSVLQTPGENDDEDEIPSRPKTIRIFSNTMSILSFDEAEERAHTQLIELAPGDWDPVTHTATITTKFVKFQNCSAFTMFVVDVEREGAEKVRLDRLRVIGEKVGEKVDMAKLKQDTE
ncbi:PITH domain-containing protein [Geopyxis carbonaria]|nr:PITH domain-containing protein [Geopyxis carbonaria]